MKILTLLILLLLAHLAKAKLSEERQIEGYITTISQDEVTIFMHGNHVTVPKKEIPREKLRPGQFVKLKVSSHAGK